MGNYSRNISKEDIVEIAKTLKEKDVEYVVFGGVALNLHGIARATRDIDVFIKNESKNVDRFFRAFNDLSMFDEVSEDQLKEYKNGNILRYAVIKLTGEFDLDLTVKMNNTGIEDLDSEVVTFEGVDISIITLQQLYKMKEESSRIKDKEDVKRILKFRGNDIK